MRGLVSLLAVGLSCMYVQAFEFPTTSEHAQTGDSQTVTLEQKNVFHLAGKTLKVGDDFPSMLLQTSELSLFDTGVGGKARIFNVLASVDTPVCVQQAQELEAFIKSNPDIASRVDIVAISADTVFAQQRFIKAQGLTNTIYLSDAKDHVFGQQTGMLISELGLLTRSIVVVDAKGKVKHIQRVPELTSLPNLEEAVAIALK
ncbi:redoxin family protein [Pseudoalteromonas xiamenensis]|uniref:redoxin family protein n=1 Tax=Pseudoalteromonas xiamenensis TaxID=882626 RepID=UPI0035EFEDB0